MCSVESLTKEGDEVNKRGQNKLENREKSVIKRVHFFMEISVPKGFRSKEHNPWFFDQRFQKEQKALQVDLHVNNQVSSYRKSNVGKWDKNLSLNFWHFWLSWFFYDEQIQKFLFWGTK